jgi:hypothetical protein
MAKYGLRICSTGIDLSKRLWEDGRMIAATFAEDFEKTLKFEPIKGQANKYIIRARKPFRRVSSKERMSPADWDKFEKDITAFKQVP